ncbi:hypothetical protein PUR71_31660 [Streptomyces sp. SP17BM10]|uniref:hypothetical protein n=1 Tax=Streptomyces sp. SP17BM10 TaxID=3002530 RepID=UPI002E782615|nr:hypothetical protein [Streptomyces sp. SP17BM10]MEE1787426.1 hypothetical protein [Streptomyces sp. SP17BM10]
MRTLLQIRLGTEASNGPIADGTMGQKFERIMAALKPEAAYFYASGGRRAMTIVVDLPDEAALPSVCEPFWVEFNAEVDAYPCMDGDALREGLSRLGG